MPTTQRGNVRTALDRSIAAAKHLSDLDSATVEAARALADKIDAWNVIVEWAHEDAAAKNSRPAVPQNDNTSLGSFLRYMSELGLTPMSRRELEAKTTGAGKLAQLRAVQGGRAAG